MLTQVLITQGDSERSHLSSLRDTVIHISDCEKIPLQIDFHGIDGSTIAKSKCRRSYEEVR
jgi:hypothetical protein